ncbi:MAG TPA: sigma-E factor negative regulatory protein [Lysobacter sp.]
MMANNNQHEDREALSALFDGELQDDAGRFALKRLSHDANWRETCGRWQLAGDVLRGQATIAAPRGFAERVAASIVAADMTPAARVSIPKTRSAPAATASRRQWIGGAALAASVALVAILVARPFSQEPATTSAPATQVAVSDRPTPVSAAPASTPAAEPPISAGGLAAAAATVAVAEVPRRSVERRSSRSQGQRAALRRRSAPPAVASSAANVVVASASVQPVPSNAVNPDPFHPHATEITTRPWPRAVLPNAPAAGAFTANYGNASPSSFYPFEPRLPASESPPSSDGGPQP